jgi:carboxyl-terminal processing protease
VDAVNKLTGPTGSQVTIKVWREGETKPLDFTLTRSKIKVESVFSKVLPGDIGFLRLSKFQDDTAQAVRAALEDFNRQNVKGVIVDVRNNAGGLLDRAVEICDLFMPKGQTIVSIRGRGPSNNREYLSLEDPICNQPLIVLVNKASASASEIFAGAMKDTHRGIIVGPKGKTTFGKGSVQTISTLKHSLDRDDKGNPLMAGLRLTTAKYYTPSGVSIHEKGIAPDIGVDLPADYELNLLRHGMLGDPSLIEPGKDDAETTGTAMLEEEGGDVETSPTQPAADPQASENKLIEKLSGKDDTKQKAQWNDTMLEEAMKYLKAILIYESKKAA